MPVIASLFWQIWIEALNGDLEVKLRRREILQHSDETGVLCRGNISS
jgi:hypothetical protein